MLLTIAGELNNSLKITMARGNVLKGEDRTALIELIKEEIQQHKEGILERMSRNIELSEMAGVSTNTISRCITESIPEGDIKYREDKNRIFWIKITRKKELPIKAAVRNKKEQAIAEFILKEIELHKAGEIDRLSTNVELGERFGINGRTIRHYLNLDDEARNYRTSAIKSYTVSKNNSNYGNPSLRRDFEEMSQHAKKSYNEGKGIGGLSTEQRQEFSRKSWEKEGRREKMKEVGRKVGIASRDNKKGLFGMDPKKKSEIGRRMGKINGSRTAENIRMSSYNIENRFCSASQQEGAVALMLEKYIPNYSVIEGINFQVKNRGISNGGIDFLVDGEFLEWHPIVLSKGLTAYRGDIPAEEFSSYNKILNLLTCEERKNFDEDYRKVLALNYKKLRQEAVNNSRYNRLNVALATDVSELYNFISRHSSSMPSFDEFKREFNSNIKYAKSFKVEKAELAVA